MRPCCPLGRATQTKSLSLRKAVEETRAGWVQMAVKAGAMEEVATKATAAG